MVRWAKALLFVLAALSLAACDEDGNPVSPSPGSPTPISITIGGRTSFDHPGETGQLTATATFRDGTLRDVTAEALWVGAWPVVSITRAGVMTALRYGTATVTARYQAVSGTAWVRVAPTGAFLISGSVRAAGGFPLPLATVEFSSRCGTHSATTGGGGVYVLPAEGETTMRVRYEGLREDVRQITPVADMTVDFELQPLQPAGDLSGAYRLVVTASSSCVLPPEAMQRSHDGQILQLGSDLFVRLTGANLVAWAGETGFTGSRDGNTVHFVVRDTIDEGYNFIERIAGTSFDSGYLHYSGTAVGTADQTRIVAAFSGTLDLRSHGNGTGISLAKCEAADHRFELTRSGATASRLVR